MLTDQLAWIRDHGHQRRMTEENGRDALRLACAAGATGSACRGYDRDCLSVRHSMTQQSLVQQGIVLSATASKFSCATSAATIDVPARTALAGWPTHPA
jgi:hypothetical protein